jgi:hypothetical protein
MNTVTQLNQGEYYRIVGGKNHWEQFNPALFVRNERIGCQNWSVFAAVYDREILQRVRIPADNLEVISLLQFDSEVHSAGGLVNKIIIFPRNERARCINTFIEEAYRLARRTYSLEEDTYSLATRNDEKAKLRIIIDNYHRH